MSVYVVTNVEMGWDCVCGVFSTVEGLAGFFAPEDDWDENGYIKKDSPFYNMSLDELKDRIQLGPYVIHDKNLNQW